MKFMLIWTIFHIKIFPSSHTSMLSGPVFQSSQYSVQVQENVKTGTNIANVQAHDIDSGKFGTAGIRYTDLRGQLARVLSLDPITGAITTSNDNSERSAQTFFDREKSNFHYLTVEARDDNGEGNRNTVEILIYVTDMNDNAPLFELNQYETYLPEVIYNYESSYFPKYLLYIAI